jgi:ABC-type nitrate/sulfonate/bicarbonate transport system substrate-binding protein
MMKRIHNRWATIVVISFLLALAAGASRAAPPQPEPLGISYVPSNSIPWDINTAIEMGYFRDEGFEPKGLTFQNAIQSAQLLINGSVELSVGQIDPFLSAVLRGSREIGFIAAPLDRPDWFLSARPEIKSAADLKGKLIGVASLQVGEAWLTRSWLKQQGCNESECGLINVGTTPSKFAALQRGSIAAAVMFQPLGITVEQMGFPTLYRYADGPRFPPVIYAVSRKWAAVNDRGKRVARALVRAHKWLFDPANREAAIAILQKYSKRERPVMEANYDFFIGKTKLMNEDGAIELAGVENEIKVMAENGAVPKGATIAPDQYLLPKELGGLSR